MAYSTLRGKLARMTTTLTLLCVLFQSAALLHVALGFALLHQKLRIHAGYGYQSPTTLRDAAAWRAVNVATGWDLVAIGVTLAVLALSLWLTGAPPGTFGITCAGWLLLGATAIVLHALWMSQRRS